MYSDLQTNPFRVILHYLVGNYFAVMTGSLYIIPYLNQDMPIPKKKKKNSYDCAYSIHWEIIKSIPVQIKKEKDS